MARIGANRLAEWTGGEWQPGPPEQALRGACNDTRRLWPGELFVAIRTERRDGHDFLESAAKAGAAGALTHRHVEGVDLPQLVVDDTRLALQRAASRYREELGATVIGITGSCGKTTVKDLLLSLLGGEPEAQATRGNLNNLLGVPMTLLGMDAERCRYAIVEAGISEPGEMAALAEMIKPDIAVYTAIGPAHLEALGTVENVAREKGNLGVEGRTRRSYCGETCGPFMSHLAMGETQSVRRVEEPSQTGEYTLELVDGRSSLSLRLGNQVETYRFGGRSAALASNVALATLVARDLGVARQSIQERLDLWEPSGMRGQWVTLGERGIYVDCYNANPLSMKDALETFEVLSRADRPRLFVLGCMEELGAATEEMHWQLGRDLPARTGDRVRVIGRQASTVARSLTEREIEGLDAKTIDSVEELGDEARGFGGDTLLKGSRRYRLEAVLDMIMEEESRAGC